MLRASLFGTSRVSVVERTCELPERPSACQVLEVCAVGDLDHDPVEALGGSCLLALPRRATPTSDRAFEVDADFRQEEVGCEGARQPTVGGMFEREGVRLVEPDDAMSVEHPSQGGLDAVREPWFVMRRHQRV